MGTFFTSQIKDFPLKGNPELDFFYCGFYLLFITWTLNLRKILSWHFKFGPCHPFIQFFSLAMTRTPVYFYIFSWVCSATHTDTSTVLDFKFRSLSPLYPVLFSGFDQNTSLFFFIFSGAAPHIQAHLQYEISKFGPGHPSLHPFSLGMTRPPV